MTTATSSVIADVLAQNARQVLGLGSMMLDGVKDEHFARKPIADGKVVNTNHPAFIFGHLAIYPPRLLGLIELDASGIVIPDTFPGLFEPGNECHDDPDGTIYPSRDVIMDVFTQGHTILAERLATVQESVLAKENPRDGRIKQICPTLGSFAAFLTSTHPMLHFGQISAWRRMMGYGSAM
ncbi:MAG: DinB family protein [Phycisphaeraceae bacterium]|nr:hypothetical protein [Phycisphaerales bacterium]MCB9860961.1 DinB family protein [Phycisphaeraceae bacterium]